MQHETWNAKRNTKLTHVLQFDNKRTNGNKTLDFHRQLSKREMMRRKKHIRQRLRVHSDQPFHLSLDIGID